MGRMGRKEPFCVVICSYNEAARLPRVLAPLSAVPELAAITVVDDGSEDDTAQVVRRWAERDPRLRLVRHAENLGKGAAIETGAYASPLDLVVLLDGDLVGLRPQHVRDLAAPVAAGRAAMTVGVFRRGRPATDFTQALSPILNGQRCLRWSLFRDTPGLAESRGGAEVALSLHAHRQGYAVRHVPLLGMTHVRKIEKQPWLAGNLAHGRMMGDIVRYLWQNTHA